MYQNYPFSPRVQIVVNPGQFGSSMGLPGPVAYAPQPMAVAAPFPYGWGSMQASCMPYNPCEGMQTEACDYRPADPFSMRDESNDYTGDFDNEDEINDNNDSDRPEFMAQHSHPWQEGRERLLSRQLSDLRTQVSCLKQRLEDCLRSQGRQQDVPVCVINDRHDVPTYKPTKPCIFIIREPEHHRKFSHHAKQHDVPREEFTRVPLG